MNAQACQPLTKLRSLTNMETYIKTARTELTGNPRDDQLRAFIDVVEGLLAEEKTRLGQVGQGLGLESARRVGDSKAHSDTWP
jgi:hypothetical protein